MTEEQGERIIDLLDDVVGFLQEIADRAHETGDGNNMPSMYVRKPYNNRDWVSERAGDG